MDVSDVRRRLRAAIDAARREAAARRERSDAAHRDYETFLAERATPALRLLASVLAGEGHRFRIFTPAESVRLVSESSSDDFIELALDTTLDPPRVVGRTSHGRGRRNTTSERVLRDGTPIADLTDEDVFEFLLGEVVSLIER
jgi:hypothetical protein